MIVGVPKETYPGERRVALTPSVLSVYKKSGMEVLVQKGAGEAAGFPDAHYQAQGAKIAQDRREVFASADLLLQVRAWGANLEEGKKDLDLYREGQTVLGHFRPLSPEAAKAAQELAAKGVNLVAMELVPRITRAQSMDALSSQATVAGYKAVLAAADLLPRMFPMLMTAAGTITPARVFVIGAGVAGLSAIATARRLGATVKAYDVRPAVKEQIESLGATFLELPLEAGEAEDKGGYARAMDEAFYEKQRKLMAETLKETDVVITTAAIPGKKAPLLLTEPMLKGMEPGSVIVDLAAETGGNCEATRPDETREVHGVQVLGPTNLPSTVPYHASSMYARNVANLVKHLAGGEGKLELNLEDEITRGVLVAKGGEVIHPRVKEILGLPAEAGK